MNTKVKSQKSKVKSNFTLTILNKTYSGQAVIIVLLIMVVALTIGLSISSRSIRDIRLATRTEESQRAFSAAEAGLEAALLSGIGTGGRVLFGTGTYYEVEIGEAGGGEEFVFPGTIGRDDTQQVWLVSHDSTSGELSGCTPKCYKLGTIEIYWGNKNAPEADNNTPALEVSVIYKEGGVYKVAKSAYDSYASGRGNNFNSSDVQVASLENLYNVGGRQFRFKVTQLLPSSADEITALRLRILYSGDKHVLGVKSTNKDGANGLIPVQGKMYDAKGYAEVTGGGESEVRRVSFFKSYPVLPGIFDFVLFSGSDLSK